jgi:hypothetical protein
MSKNIGALDRWLRIIAGAVILSLVVVGPKSNWGWLGLIPLLTGLVGNCPIYQVFGISTCPTKPRPST